MFATDSLELMMIVFFLFQRHFLRNLSMENLTASRRLQNKFEHGDELIALHEIDWNISYIMTKLNF